MTDSPKWAKCPEKAKETKLVKEQLCPKWSNWLNWQKWPKWQYGQTGENG